KIGGAAGSGSSWNASIEGEVMSVPNLVIIGADKGGVGKTMITRTVVDYFVSKGLVWRAIDTESPDGVLKRFYPAKTEVVDLSRSDGQMQVLDTLKSAAVTIIDMRAGLLSSTLKMLAEIGFLNGVAEGKLKITVLHVIGSSQASFAEIQSTAKLVAGA